MRRLLQRLAGARPTVPALTIDPTDEPAMRRLRALLTSGFAWVWLIAAAPVPFLGAPGVPPRPAALPVLLALLALAVLTGWRRARLTDGQFLAAQLVHSTAAVLVLLMSLAPGSLRSAELVLAVPMLLTVVFAPARWHAVLVTAVVVAGADVVSAVRLVAPADAWSQAAAQTIALLALAGLVRALRDSAYRGFAAVRLAEVTDQLTGALNRLGFERHGGALWNQVAADGRRLAVLALSLDHFKTVNDLWGHAGGDDMLARLGAVLRESTRDGDLTVRLGGAEFAVLCPVQSGEGPLVADRLRQDLARAIAPGTVSIGVVEVAPERGDRGVDELLRTVLVASSCLDQAKRTGRNRVVTQEV